MSESLSPLIPPPPTPGSCRRLYVVFSPEWWHHGSHLWTGPWPTGLPKRALKLRWCSWLVEAVTWCLLTACWSPYCLCQLKLWKCHVLKQLKHWLLLSSSDVSSSPSGPSLASVCRNVPSASQTKSCTPWQTACDCQRHSFLALS